MQSILVAGGAGFIGSAFCRMLLQRSGYRVAILDKLTYAGNLDSFAEWEGSSQWHFCRAGIESEQVVLSFMREHDVDAVINFAAETHVDRSIDEPAPFLATNVLGLQHLLEASKTYWRELPRSRQDSFRFLQVSTDEVYGSLGDHGRFDENAAYAPNSPYAASKAAGDHLVRAYHKTYGLPTLVTHASNNYGPFQFPEKLIPLMILNAIDGKPLPVYGDGRNVRDWLYVEDHCEGLWLALTTGTPGDRYNFGGNEERTNLEVVHELLRSIQARLPTFSIADAQKRIEFVIDRPGHDRRYALDSTKAKRELGWEPSRSFEAGLDATVGWYLGNRRWVQRIEDGSYARERIGLEHRK